MAWCYEILGKNNVLLEKSEVIYETQFEAQYAGYQRMKEKPGLQPLPDTGWIEHGGGLRSVTSLGVINARWEE